LTSQIARNNPPNIKPVISLYDATRPNGSIHMTHPTQPIDPTRPLDATLVTGGAGFIGSAVVRELLAQTAGPVVVLDLLTYAGGRDNLPDDPRVQLVEGDIADAACVDEVFRATSPGRVLHLAAESHVDRSIDGPMAFVRTNLQGTAVLLEAARAWWGAAPAHVREGFRFVHVSTDEVFGSLGDEGCFHPETPYDPRSPYSASKAGSDHLARAWQHTFGLPVVVTNCSNNYGPRQHPEKLIPHMILRALSGGSLPVYGTGGNVRDWLHVEDHARGLVAAALRGVPGATYLFGGRAERRNLEVVETLCHLLDARRPEAGPHTERIAFVTDRPGHDHRYAVDPSFAEAALGWRTEHDFESGLRATLDWYLENPEWCEARVQGAGLVRRGVAEAKG
jgi:dTDP-glucose 4,6-dehydratase